MTGAVLFISFAILLLMGTPIAVCLGVSSVGAMLVDGSGKPIETIMTTLPRIFSSSTSKSSCWPSRSSSWAATSWRRQASQSVSSILPRPASGI